MTFYKLTVLLEINDDIAQGDELEIVEGDIYDLCESFDLTSAKVRMGATKRLDISDFVS